MLIAALLVTAPGSLAPARAQGEAAVHDFVAALDRQLHVIRADTGEAAIRTACRGLPGRILDVDAMARAAVRDKWGAITPSQRSAYRAAFHDRMLSVCARLVRDYHGDKITLLGVRSAEGGDRLATIRLGADEENGRMVTWRLHGTGGSLKAIDVISDGRSAVSTARNEYSAILDSNNGNFDALIDFLRRQGPCSRPDCS